MSTSAPYQQEFTEKELKEKLYAKREVDDQDKDRAKRQNSLLYFVECLLGMSKLHAIPGCRFYFHDTEFVVGFVMDPLDITNFFRKLRYNGWEVSCYWDLYREDFCVELKNNAYDRYGK